LLADLRAGTPQFTFSPLVTPYKQKTHSLEAAVSFLFGMTVGWNKLRAVAAIQADFDSRLPELRGACSSLRKKSQRRGGYFPRLQPAFDAATPHPTTLEL
jgi:hypothetical protein